MLDAYGIVQTIAPATEILSVAEAKAHCRVEHSADDAYLAALIQAAARRIEHETGRQLVTATWKQTLSCFPCWEIELARSPLIAVSSIVYVDADGTVTTLSSSLYEIDAARQPGIVQPAWGQVWPVAREQAQAVRVTFTAGYGAAASSVPEPIRQAARMLVGHWHRNRESVVAGSVTPLPQAVEWLLAPYGDGRYA